MKKRWLISITVLVFFSTLISQMPATLLAAYAKPRNAPPVIYGASGTLADGHAAALNIGGRIFSESLHWTLRPLWSWIGRLAFDIEGNGTAAVSGQVQYGLGGLRLRNMQAEGGLKDMAATAGFPFVPAEGRLSLKLDALLISGGVPRSATGQIEIRGLQWTLAHTPTALGSFRADTVTEGDVIVATISSIEGPLEASGQARLIPKDNRYETELTLKPKPGADPAVAQLLQGLGAPDAQGAYHLRSSGTLP